MNGQTPEAPPCTVPNCTRLVVILDPLPLCAEDGMAVLRAFSSVATGQAREEEVADAIAHTFAPFRLEGLLPTVEYIETHDLDRESAIRVQRRLIHMLADWGN